MFKERRLSDRHFIRLPIHYCTISPQSENQRQTKPAEKAEIGDCSEGGLMFLTSQRYPVGTFFEMTFPLKDKLFTLKAEVVHVSLEEPSGFYRTGVRFASFSDLFKIKMAEQLCLIEEYRKTLSKEEGRLVTEEEAARKWIGKHSRAFGAFYGEESTGKD